MINLINKGTEIKKLPKSFMEDVSKEKNEPLFKIKISEILCEQEIPLNIRLSVNLKIK